MINKLTYDQIVDCWDLIKEGLEEALPYPIAGRHKYRESNILSSLLSGAMDCWLAYEKDEENETILLYSAILASVYVDECTGNRSFYVFAQLGFRDVPRKMWREGFNALIKYAKSQGCHMLTAHTNVPGVIETFKRLGGSAEYTYITLPLEGNDEVDEF